ncbi:hypothetical protein GGI07_003142 [Coemansia sp. Benny D115]|nr:hypothetical protein GGI07_003142 [Coemansia sp. Benny D115]
MLPMGPVTSNVVKQVVMVTYGDSLDNYNGAINEYCGFDNHPGTEYNKDNHDNKYFYAGCINNTEYSHICVN